jgi:RNA polymerase subunit RPABC4/transcription elongation factor Spt4
MTADAEYRICPSCHDEYTATTSRCAECNVELVAESALPPEEPSEAFPPPSELTCIRVAPLPWIRALSEALEQKGVAHRVEPARVTDAPEGQRAESFGDVDLFGLYVRERDADPVRKLDAAIAVDVLPEEVLDRSQGEEACPACGTVLHSESDECPDCGIAFA